MKKKILLICLAACMAFSAAFALACDNVGNGNGSDVPSGAVSDSGGDSTGSASDSNSSGGASQEQSCVVQFNTDGAGDIDPVTVKKGEKLSEPQTPKKSSEDYEYEFVGWFLGEKEWDFANDKVVEDITLVAHWEENAKYTDPFLPKD